MSTEVPLANIGDEWNDFTDHQNSNDNLSKSISRSNKSKGESSADCILDLDGEEDDEDIVSYTESETKAAERPILSDNALVCDSIQELVQNFDEQIINCFTDYDQPIEQLAPVQVLNQDELINECQLWWTLTSKFGQMLPINWKQTYIRSRFLSSLLGESESRPKNSRKCSMNACIKSHSTIDLESEEDRLVSQACNYLSYLDSIHRSPSLPNTVRSPDCCSDCDPKSIGSDDHFRRRRAAEDELDDDEQLAKDLDFHCLILCSASGTTDQQKVNRDETRSMPFTAEQVLDEIDAWMQDDALTAEHEQLADQMHVLGAAHTNSGGDSECTTLDSGLADTNGMSDSLCLTKSGVSGSTSTYSLSGDVTPIRPDRIGVEILDTNSIESNRLADFGICQLNELYLDLERAIQQLSEVLIQQLALRDELEYEKEQKNTFISLLLGIQAKRRKLNLQRKGGGRVNEGGKHLSTMIPYPTNSGPPDLPTLQVLIKILKAINDDSPAVPALLTDFILKVLCAT